MTWILAQLVQNALKMLAVVAGIFFLGGWAWFAYFNGPKTDGRMVPAPMQGQHHRNDASRAPAEEDAESYAHKMFGGLLPIEAVLASKAGASGCTYAVVRTGDGIARTPPTSALGTAWWARFGGDWRQTPERVFGNLPADALSLCRSEWPAALGDELQQTLDTPGAWYMRSASGEDLHMFSADGRLAARIRYGS